MQLQNSTGVAAIFVCT